MRKKKKELRDYLAQKSRAHIERIENIVSDYWATGDPIHPWFTLHGPRHCEQVEKNANYVLGPEHSNVISLEKFLDNDQTFFLLAAIWLHDVGMIVPPTKVEKDSATEQDINVADLIRRQHHIRSEQYVIKNADILGLDSYQASIIGRVCLGHRQTDLTDKESFPETYPNQQFLAAVLRLADELDISWERTPEPLMRLKWSEMDDIARWHWLKHWCIPKIIHQHYFSMDESPPILRLAFDVTVRVPDHRFISPFREEILRPIRRTLIDEGLQVILRNKQLDMDLAGFRCSYHYVNPELDNGVYLMECFETALVPRLPMSKKVEELLIRIRRDFGGEAGGLLFRQCQRLLIAAAPIADVAVQTNEALEEFLLEISVADSSTSAQKARSIFREKLVLLKNVRNGELNNEGTLVEGASHELMSEWENTGNLAWRLAGLMKGEPAERLSQLNHLLTWLGTTASNLAGWIVKNETDERLKETAMRRLCQYAKERLVSCFEIALIASKDENSRIRVMAAQALGYLNGPGARVRLSEMAEGDIDGEVRRSAIEALKHLAGDGHEEDMLFTGKHVAIIESDQYFISSIVDELKKRNCKTVVYTNYEDAKEELRRSLPDIIICELCRFNEFNKKEDRSMGELVGRFIRNELNTHVPIIATGISDPEEYSMELVGLCARYIKKPCTVEHIIRTIYSELDTSTEN
jgi:hypothetical protein